MFCSGKIAYEAIARRDERGAPVAVLRIEQLYPFPYQRIRDIFTTYPNVEQGGLLLDGGRGAEAGGEVQGAGGDVDVLPARGEAGGVARAAAC